MRIAWESQGEGRAVLLVQGLGYTREGWGPLRARLAEGHRVVSFDNRGIGASEIPPGPYTIEALAEDTVQVLDEAGIDRAHLVGASLGGFVAQVVAADRPERVERLVLACTSPGGPSAYPMPEQTVRLFGEAAKLAPEIALRRFTENAVSARAPDELVEEIFAYRRAYPPDPAGWTAQASAGAAWDTGDRLERIDAPTLVVTGDEDTVVDPRNSELLTARIPGAQLEVLAGAGHLLFWEQPEAFAAILEGFLG